MIQLPDFSKAFEYENNFYLSSDITRTSKFLAHYELYKMVHHLPGAMIECGVFKGASFVRWATFRELTANPFGQKLIGFDIFGKFPETNFEEDKNYREKFVQSAGEESIGTDQLMEVLRHKRLDRNVELVAGDVCQTVPKYVQDNPHLKISLINLDTDVYEPAVTILEHLYPRLVRGGVLILDDYGTFPGETKAVDDYFKGKNITIRKFPFAMTPCFVVKED
jgi:hypothetical protein